MKFNKTILRVSPADRLLGIMLFGILLFSALLFSASLAAQQGSMSSEEKSDFSMDELLQQVKQGRAVDGRDNVKRLKDFRQARAEQKRLFAELKAEEKREEEISDQREKQFEGNEKSISLLEERLTDRLGALKELFGVLQQVSSDAQGQFSMSLTQLQYPDRAEFLTGFSSKMGQTKVLPSIEEIERLWFELQREMTDSGKIVRRTQAVVTSEGQELQQEVIRVGAFNIVSNGKYLQFIPETGRVLEYARQPASRFLAGAKDISAGSKDVVSFTIDPTRGQLLSLLVASPKLRDRIDQGGIIGYAIIFLGFIAVIIAVIRYALLTVIQGKVYKQIKQPSVIGDNPLGRILDEYESHKDRELDTLELKMGEAVMREVPKINRGLAFLKIIAAIAPLMGLLGTVTGMIITFQTIVLYGAGDPKLMAGGISQALVTTVLGLTVAIPTLLLHNLVQTRAKSITEVLEQEAVAIIATQAEQQQSNGA